jgi:hypothetical protein
VRSEKKLGLAIERRELDPTIRARPADRSAAGHRPTLWCRTVKIRPWQWTGVLSAMSPSAGIDSLERRREPMASVAAIAAKPERTGRTPVAILPMTIGRRSTWFEGNLVRADLSSTERGRGPA